MSYLFVSDWGNCENCIYHKHINETRLEPSEDWCECWNEYYDGKREYDEDGDELPCEDFRGKDLYEE